MCLSAVSEVEPYASRGARTVPGGRRREAGPYPLDDRLLSYWPGRLGGLCGWILWIGTRASRYDRYSVRNLIR